MGGRSGNDEGTSCTLQNGLGNCVESRFWVFRISLGKEKKKKKKQISTILGKLGLGDRPRKVARIFAAFSASPGKLKPCANVWDDDCTLLEPSLKRAEAWMPALAAPFLNLSKMDIASVCESHCGAAKDTELCHMRIRDRRDILGLMWSLPDPGFVDSVGHSISRMRTFMRL